MPTYTEDQVDRLSKEAAEWIMLMLEGLDQLHLPIPRESEVKGLAMVIRKTFLGQMEVPDFKGPECP